MKDLFVPYEIAIQLKEVGFNEPCLAHYSGENFTYSPVIMGRLFPTKKVNKHEYLAPTFSQTFKWFEKNHVLKCWVEWGSEYLQLAYYQNSSGMKYFISEHGTKEKAEIACLKKLIELVKNK